jgi:hypothetical protein
MRKGILIGGNGDLEIQVRCENGLIVSGIVIGESDYQNIDFLVRANKGDFKEYPILGVGAEKWLKSVEKQEALRREIAVQLGADGYKTNDISVSNTGIVEINT